MKAEADDEAAQSNASNGVNFSKPCGGPPACKTDVKFQSEQIIMYSPFDAAFIVAYRFFRNGDK